MPRLTPARAEARRRQVLEAAVACFARDGFQRATMQDVVREAGLSPGAIYCHFRSKEEIAFAAVGMRRAEELTLLKAVLANPDPATAIEQLVAAFLARLKQPDERTWRALAVQLWAESLRDERMLAVVQDGVRQAQILLAAVLRDAFAKRPKPGRMDPDALARVLVAVFQGLTLQHAWDETQDFDGCAAVLKAVLKAVLQPLVADR
jgi:AcrR family transcriptional regulator